jgi:hypothetical protein
MSDELVDRIGKVIITGTAILAWAFVARLILFA